MTREAALEALDDWRRGFDHIAENPDNVQVRRMVEKGIYYIIQQHFATIRAALADRPAASAEREECARQCEVAAHFVVEDGDYQELSRALIKAARLLRESPSQWQTCTDAKARDEGCWRAIHAEGELRRLRESPSAKGAPGEAVARRWKKRINCGQGQFIESEWSYTGYAPDDELELHPNVIACEPLYAAPPAAAPQEAKRWAFVREHMDAYEGQDDVWCCTIDFSWISPIGEGEPTPEKIIDAAMLAAAPSPTGGEGT